MTRSLRLALACALLVAATSATALAQPTGDKKKALDLYDKGNTQYNLGRWKPAIELFTQAYEVYNAPEFLFNIAQAHRQDGNCSEALFFYRRYLANKPNATNKTEVDGFIKELDGKCTEATGGTTGTGTTGTGTTGTGTTGTGTTGTGTTGTGTGTTGTGTTGTGTTGTGTTGTGKTGTGKTGTGKTRTADTTTTVDNDDDDTEVDDDDGSIDVSETGGKPHLFTASLGVGPSFMTSGDLNKPVHMAFALGAGYPISIDKASFEPGVLVTYSPIPWEGEVEGMEVTGTAGLTALMANAAGGYPIIPSLPALSARAEVGLGVLVMSGLERGNPFLDSNQFADGSIAMFHARVALGAEYMVTPNLAVFAQPVVFSFSPASKLRDEISSVTRYEILFGAGYKM
ncbi:MAG TPA: tetratricopeptide repeat protein [Kofleriaceae bacterium]|jgi:hypothetical protein